MTESKKLLERWRDAGDEKIQDFVNELLSNPRFAQVFGQAIAEADAAKKTVDRNLRLALNLANVPTKADYEDLVRKVVKLGDSVAKLELRLDTIGGRLERLADKLAAKTPKQKR
jgi:hypothetical protein